MTERSTMQASGLEVVPDYDRLFSLIRAAGPSNAAKARAVDHALADARRYCLLQLSGSGNQEAVNQIYKPASNALLPKIVDG